MGNISYTLTKKWQQYFTNTCKDINTSAFLLFLSVFAEMIKWLLLLFHSRGKKKRQTKTKPLPISSLISFFHEFKWCVK